MWAGVDPVILKVNLWEDMVSSLQGSAAGSDCQLLTLSQIPKAERRDQGCAKMRHAQENEPQQISALIVASSDPLRESLAVLVRSIQQVGRIEQAEDLSSALLENAGRPPHLILCDFEAVQDETVETLRRVKVQWPHVRCVVLVKDETDSLQALAVGADVVLTKGILAARLLETIKELLPE
jgi:CheY-like chemotaxis protein